jgi:hypothetical protein
VQQPAQASAQPVQQQQQPATAGTAADPFASLGSHDLISSIQTMAVSTNAPAAAALAPAASAGSATGQQQQQHSRSNSGSGAAAPVKTAEDILKLYDAPMQQQPLAAPVAAVGGVSQPQYGFMSGAPGGMPLAGVQQPPRPPVQQQQQQLGMGSTGSGFTHHPMSVMTPVVPAGSSTAAGFGNDLVGSGTGSAAGAMGSTLI